MASTVSSALRMSRKRFRPSTPSVQLMPSLRQPAIALGDLIARLPCLELREDRQRSDKIEQRDEQRPPPAGGAWQDQRHSAPRIGSATTIVNIGRSVIVSLSVHAR